MMEAWKGKGFMDKKRVLHTARLALRFATEEDIPTIMALEQHPDNRSFVCQGTKEQHHREVIDPDCILWVFTNQADDSLVGYCLVWINRESNWAELRRIVITQKGQGYGREALKGLFSYLFDEISVNKVWLDVYPHNAVGISLYESLGMSCDGRLRQNFYDERLGYLDQLIYSRLKREHDREDLQ